MYAYVYICTERERETQRESCSNVHLSYNFNIVDIVDKQALCNVDNADIDYKVYNAHTVDIVSSVCNAHDVHKVCNVCNKATYTKCTIVFNA